MPEEETHAFSALLAGIREGIEVVSVAVEVPAIGIIVVGIVAGTASYWRRSAGSSPDPDAYEQYKRRLARSLLLGLEIPGGGGHHPHGRSRSDALEALAALCLLVVVGTFLSWALVVEMEGHWPWQQHAAVAIQDSRTDEDR